jgi:surface polysaccharide O-acyltransferase-like enzyme
MTEIVPKIRDNRLDFIRGLAMCGIVMIHVNSYFEFFHSQETSPVLLTLVLSNLSRFSVPVFIFSAGYFSRDKNFFEYWKPKITSILVPYLIFSTIGFFVKFPNWDFSNFVNSIVFGKSLTPYYFIPLLFQFYILFYLILKLLSTQKMWYVSFIALVVNILSNEGYLNFLPASYEPISIFNFIFFFVIGIQFSRFGFNKIEDSKYNLFVVRALYFITFCYVVYISIVNLIHLKNHTILYPCLTFLVLYSLKVIPWVSDKMAIVGKESMGIFLLHPFLIHFMHAVDPYFWGGSYFSILVVWILNIILPLIIWLGINKLKLMVFRP